MSDELLTAGRVAHLATSDQYAKPHVATVVFVWLEPNLYIPLDPKLERDDDWHALRRIRNLETNGRVSVVVDRWDERWERLAWVLLDGLATILESGEERDRAAAALVVKYPQHANLPPSGQPIVRVAVEHITRWSAAEAGE